MKAVALVCAIVLAALTGGCSSDSEKVVPTSSDADRHYALLADAGWTLQEAIDPRADDPLIAAERPALDWYDEYVRSPSATESQMVRVSGHEADFDESRGAFEDRGYQLDDVTIAGRQAAGGFLPGDTPRSSLLVLDNNGSTLLVLSYELNLADLTALAEKIRPVSAAAWIAAGGVIR